MCFVSGYVIFVLQDGDLLCPIHKELHISVSFILACDTEEGEIVEDVADGVELGWGSIGSSFGGFVNFLLIWLQTWWDAGSVVYK